MYNLNVDLATSAANAVNSLLVESNGTTPRTPEILNSLIAMTNPMDSYAFGDGALKKAANGGGAAHSASSDSNSSASSQLGSPTANNPPSVQHTCSQLIKAGLKLTIEQKRKHQSDGEDLLDLDKIKRIKRIKRSDCSESEEDRLKQDTGIQNWTCYENDENYSNLTPEDEERRRRRRERNKIAATKCRLKKRERTANLVHESESLETTNVELKNQVQELQQQKRSLMDMLNRHRPQCRHNIGAATRDHLYRLPPVASVMETHSYSRPPSVEPGYGVGAQLQQSHETYARPAYSKPPPSIVIEDANESYDLAQFTNLETYPYSSPCHSYPAGQGYSNTGLDNGCMA